VALRLINECPLVLSPRSWQKPPRAGIGAEAIRAGFLVLYRSAFDLMRELLAEQTEADVGRMLARYLKPDLLIIDDMGLKVLPQKSGGILLEIVMRRYENRSTFMTSNRPGSSDFTLIPMMLPSPVIWWMATISRLFAATISGELDEHFLSRCNSSH